MTIKIGVLGFQGDVIEHINATKQAAKKLNLPVEVIEVRTSEDLENVVGLIIPGGESTVLQKLCKRAGIFEKLKKIKHIMGTCAGAIMLAKKIHHAEEGQKTLELMDIEVDRNAYGRQNESFEGEVDVNFAPRQSTEKIPAIFIRAPKILSVGKNVRILAATHDASPKKQKRAQKNILACEQREQSENSHHYIAVCFHPELTSTKFHEYFLSCLAERTE